MSASPGRWRRPAWWHRMENRLRIHAPDLPPPVRQVIGVHVSADCRQLRAVPVLACGNGLHLKVRIGRHHALPLPPRAGELLAAIRAPTAAGGPPFECLAELRTIVAEHGAIAAQESATQNNAVLNDTLAVGVSEPGVWSSGREQPTACFSLVEASLLANLSGINVIDGFAARDVASGGRGGPLFPLAEWILFRSAHCERVLVSMGHATRLTRLPRLNGSLASVAGLAHRVIPGMALSDLLVGQLTGGKRDFDPGGRFSVQGRRIGELVDFWIEMSRAAKSSHEWSPAGPAVIEMLQQAIRLAIAKGWSVYDMLCSASHFAAEAAAAAIEDLSGPSGAAELVLAGNGLDNGLVLRGLTARLAGWPVCRVKDLGVESDALAPAAAAILALLHLDQVPANVAGITGADVPRVLGRLTPGGPQAWQRLLAACSRRSADVRPLRAAL